MIGWGIFYYILGWYLEYVIPQKRGIRRHWLFPFYKCVSKFKSAKHDQKSSSLSNEITITNLSKSYYAPGFDTRRVVALEKFNLKVCKGEISIILGTNGAGKSTCFNILTGAIAASSGSITVLGNVMIEDGVDSVTTLNPRAASLINRLVGYVPQFDCTYPQLTVKQHLELIQALRRNSKSSLDPKLQNPKDSMTWKSRLFRYLNYPNKVSKQSERLMEELELSESFNLEVGFTFIAR